MVGVKSEVGGVFLYTKCRGNCLNVKEGRRVCLSKCHFHILVFKQWRWKIRAHIFRGKNNNKPTWQAVIQYNILVSATARTDYSLQIF